MCTARSLDRWAHDTVGRAPLLAIALACVLLAVAACGSPSGDNRTSPSGGTSGTGSPTPFHLTATDPEPAPPDCIISAASEGRHGSVDPRAVFHASGTVAFVFTPDPGYHIGSVSVDGALVTLSEEDRYTFTDVDSDHLLIVGFTRDGEAPPRATITPRVSGGHGSVDPTATQTVAAGSRPAFTLSPAEGYEVDSVRVDGRTVPSTTPTSYVFLPVTSDHTLAVSFKLLDEL